VLNIYTIALLMLDMKIQFFSRCISISWFFDFLTFMHIWLFVSVNDMRIYQQCKSSQLILFVINFFCVLFCSYSSYNTGTSFVRCSRFIINLREKLNVAVSKVIFLFCTTRYYFFFNVFKRWLANLINWGWERWRDWYLSTKKPFY